MSTIEIFPRVIGRYKLENSKHINLKNQCTELLCSIEEQHTKTNAENPNLTHYYNTSNQNLLSLEQFKWFEKWIEEKSINYIENTLSDKLILQKPLGSYSDKVFSSAVDRDTYTLNIELITGDVLKKSLKVTDNDTYMMTYHVGGDYYCSSKSKLSPVFGRRICPFYQRTSNNSSPFCKW
jgi:hypothetical protein